MPMHTKEKALTQCWEQGCTCWAAHAARQKAFCSSAAPLDTAVTAQEKKLGKNTSQWKNPHVQCAAEVAMRDKHRNQ